MRARLNKIKHRQWFRPVAPIVPLEEADQWVDSVAKLHSPYMSFAPKLRQGHAALPDLAHIDGTSRIQTCSHQQQPWLHGLLKLVGQFTGHSVLVHTSFNEKGHPILNTIKQAVRLFDDHEDIGALLIELCSEPPWTCVRTCGYARACIYTCLQIGIARCLPAHMSTQSAHGYADTCCESQGAKAQY